MSSRPDSIKDLLRVLVLFLAASSAFAQTSTIMVIAHRGEHRRHTENTLAAFANALEVGADFFEVDVRTTSDGELVLMHDRTVDRTTNGTGEVSEMSFVEVRAVRAGGEPVPTFGEALALARERSAKVYVDVKDAAAVDLVEAIESQRMSDRVVVYGSLDLLERLQRLRPELRIMPESVSLEVVRRIVAEQRPEVIAFSASDWQPDIIEVAVDAGADIYVDTLGELDNEAGWLDAIAGGATGIQTDQPAELVAFLRSKRMHR